MAIPKNKMKPHEILGRLVALVLGVTLLVAGFNGFFTGKICLGRNMHTRCVDSADFFTSALFLAVSVALGVYMIYLGSKPNEKNKKLK